MARRLKDAHLHHALQGFRFHGAPPGRGSLPPRVLLGPLSHGPPRRRTSPMDPLLFPSTPAPGSKKDGLRVDSLMTAVRTVKILAIHMDTHSLDVVINLMRCFPCLEKLYIASTGSGGNNLWRRKHRDLIRSLDIRLKKISWRYYRGIKSHVDFATFFVLSAKVLELMILDVHKDDYSEEFIAQQRKKLQLDSKASRDARFHFTPDWPYRSNSCFRVHDLDLADPFEWNEPYKFHE